MAEEFKENLATWIEDFEGSNTYIPQNKVEKVLEEIGLKTELADHYFWEDGKIFAHFCKEVRKIGNVPHEIFIKLAYSLPSYEKIINKVALENAREEGEDDD